MDMQARHAVETRHPASQGLYSQEAQREHQWVDKTKTLSSYQLAKAWLGSTLEALICEEAAALETKADEGGQTVLETSPIWSPVGGVQGICSIWKMCRNASRPRLHLLSSPLPTVHFPGARCAFLCPG